MASVALVAAAFATIIVFPARLQWTIVINIEGAIVVPVWYWIAVVGYALAARRVTQSGRPIVFRALAVGVVLHILVALTGLTPQLPVPALFSARMYWIYLRFFLAGVVVCGVVWTVDWFRRLRAARTPSGPQIVDLPVVFGTAALAAAVVYYDVGAGVAGVLVGTLVAFAIARGNQGTTRPISALPAVLTERLFVIAVFIVALILRLLYARQVMTNPGYVGTGADGLVYDQLGWSLAQGHGIPTGIAITYPLLLFGYARFVGLIYSVVGHSYFAVCAVQAALGAAACVCAYATARLLFGVAVARVTAVLSAASFQLIFSAAALGHQAVDIFLTSFAVWLVVTYVLAPRPGWFGALGMGVVMGCAIAVRETNVFFAAFIVAWVPVEITNRVGRRRAMALSGAVAIGTLLVIGPSIAARLGTADTRTLALSHLNRLFMGANDVGEARAAKIANRNVPSPRTNAPGQVVTFARGVMDNFAWQFFTQPYGEFDLISLSKTSAYYYALWFYTYVFAAVGIALTMLRARQDPLHRPGLIVVAVLVVRTLPHLVLESSYRHRAPIEPFLLMMAAVGAVWLFARAHDAGLLAAEPQVHEREHVVEPLTRL